MKPAFALNLSHDGISLLHRAKAGWLKLGEVSLDAQDLVQQLVMMRRNAADLEKGGLTTKVVLPNSQVLYTNLTAPGPDTAARIAQIRDGLVGLTPYDVKDLVFDWRPKGRRVQVAVVARETLQEAEAFATEHRFNPVSFVALPEPHRFDGEPFFGPSAFAARLLSPGEGVEPDAAAIAILDPARRRRKPAAAPQEKRVLEPATADAAPPAGRDPPPEPQADPPPEPRAEPTARATPASKPDAKVAPAPDGADAPAATPANPGPVDAPPAPGDGAGKTAPPAHPAATEPVAFATRRAAAGPATDPAASTPRALDRVTARFALDPAEPAEPEVRKPERTPMPVTAPQTAESSDPADRAANRRRKARETAAAAKSALATLGKLGRTAPGALDPAPAMPAAGPAAMPRPGASPAPPKQAVPPPAAARSPARTQPQSPAQSPARAASQSPSQPPPQSRAAAIPRPAPKPRQTAPRSVIPAAKATTEAEALTVFGERGRVAHQRGRPRYVGVVLTVVLLAALGFVAIWSTYFMSDVTSGWFGTFDDEIAAAPPPEASPVVLAPAPAATPPVPRPTVAAAPPPDPDAAGAAETGDTVLAALPPESDATPAADAPAGAPGTADPAPAETDPPAAETAGTAGPPDAAQLATPAGTADPVETARQGPAPAIAETPPDLPALDAPGQRDGLRPGGEETSPGRAFATLGDPGPVTDVLPDSSVLMPPAGEPLSPELAETRYAATGIWQLDPEPSAPPSSDRNDDFYVASIDPVITPEDAIALPPAPSRSDDTRPASLTPPAPPGTEFDFDARGLVRATPEGAVSPDGVLVILGRPPVVPGPRPGTASDPADRIEPAPDNRLREIRPRLRPEGLQETNQRARLGGRTVAELEVVRPPLRPVSEQAAAEADPTPTDRAILTSRSPALRPEGFARIVEASLPSAAGEVGETEGTAALPVAAAVAPPQMPPVPTRASVAREATVENAVNLGRVNLIGVYGSPSDRRALVRLPSGRYVKVKVGDRVDGGKVAAIGDSQLRYVKGGRNITLSMPSG